MLVRIFGVGSDVGMGICAGVSVINGVAAGVDIVEVYVDVHLSVKYFVFVVWCVYIYKRK